LARSQREADRFEAVVTDDGAEFFRVGEGERRRVAEGEGRDLKAVVAVAGGLGAGAGEVVVAEGFVADGEFHGGSKGFQTFPKPKPRKSLTFAVANSVTPKARRLRAVRVS
jgi:hypothetical protein